jgi:putative oxidoreductase
LLRISLGVALLCFGITGLSNPSDTIAFAQCLIAAGGGAFLLVGLWTPLMGTLVALNEFWSALSRYSLPRQETWTHVFLAALSVCVALLGPGAWSIDAHLFGRKRFDIDGKRSGRLSP